MSKLRISDFPVNIAVAGDALIPSSENLTLALWIASEPKGLTSGNDLRYNLLEFFCNVS